MNKLPKTIAIMQPTYMPWLGYFSLISKVDQFVFLNSVQLVQRSWQVRNKIKLNNDEKLLTIPIDKDNHRESRMINNTKYKDTKWMRSHLDTIKQAYNKAPFFNDIFEFLVNEYQNEYISIGDFNVSLIKALCKEIGIITPSVCSDELDISGKKDILLSAICKTLNATRYLSVPGSAEYIEVESPGGQFVKDGLDLIYQHYEHPVYNQLGNSFIPYIGIYDLLFNVGFNDSLTIIKSGEREDYSYLEYRKEILKID